MALTGALIRVTAALAAMGAGGWLIHETLNNTPGDLAASLPSDAVGARVSGPAPQPVPDLAGNRGANNAQAGEAELQPASEMGRADGSRGPSDIIEGSAIAVARAASVELPSIISAPGSERPLQFVVAVESAELDAIKALFLEDPEAAREAFDAFAAEEDNAFMADLELVTLNVNGEMTLVYVGEMPVANRERAMLARALTTRLNSHPSVLFAEPNYRTRIFKDEP
jgi:hypothetical protein